jgi:hypothetical protein
MSRDATPERLSRMASGTRPSGVSSPASHNSTRLPLRAESRLARTDPADPPPTMM